MRTTIRVLLVLLAAFAAYLGLWALLGPRSFFDTFPGLGLHWVVVDGPYNEHLVRDVGGLSLGLAVLNLVAAWRPTRALVATAAAVGLCFSVPHLVYHWAHVDVLPSSQRVAEIGSLLGPVAAGVALLVLAARLPADR